MSTINNTMAVNVMKQLVVLVFVMQQVAIFVSCWGVYTTEEETSLALPAPGFDYFLLAMQWPNKFCLNNACNPPYPKQNFTIHGLWPQLTNSQISSSGCATTEQLTDDTLDGLRDDLLTYWPDLKNDDFQNSKSFWRYEWNKHGTCSSNKYTAAQYFQKTIDLAKALSSNISEALATKGVIPNGNAYPSLEIFQAIIDGLGVVPKLSVPSTSPRYLAEIRLCVKDDAVTLISCVKDYGNVIFAAPPVLPPSPSPSPTTSLSQFPSPSRSTRWWVSSVLDAVHDAVHNAAAAIL